MPSTRSDRGIAYVLFFLWPFFSFMYAVKAYRSAIAKNLVWLFIIYYGLTFTISKSQVDVDGLRRIYYFEEWARNERIDFQTFTTMLYSDETNYIDIFEPFLMFVVSRFTSSYQILFAIYGLIFGYFYTRNIWYIIEKFNLRITKYVLPFFVTFCLIVAFWEINGFRFWTASHIFLFGTIKYLFERKNKYLLIAVFSVFVHFSFFLPVAILFVYVLLGNRPNTYFYFFIATFFLSEINLSAINNAISFLPEVFQYRAQGYTSDTAIEKVQEASTTVQNWYVTGRGIAIKIVVVLFYICVFNWNKSFFKNKDLLNLFCFGMLLYGVSNIFVSVPSMGRFVRVSHLFTFIFFSLCIHFKYVTTWFYNLFPLFMTGVFLFCIVEIRIGFDTISVLSVISNPFVAPFIQNNIPLIDLLK